jgi:uncharacterized protein involved in exopolysaccharide biosynthesis
MSHISTSDEKHLRGESEADLLSLAMIVWSRKWIVTGAGLVAGVIALVWGLLTPPTYEAAVRLVVTPPKTAVTGDIAPQVSVATYRALVENQSLAAQVLAESKLDLPPFNFSVQDFIREGLSVDTIRDTNVIVIKVRLRDAQMTARVANRLAVLSVELAQRLNQEEIVRARDAIQTQVTLSKDKLDSLQAGLEEFKKKTQIELLEKDVDAILDQREGLLRLVVDVQAEKAWLAAAEEQLAKRSRVISLTRTIDGDPALMEAAREAGGNPKSLLGLQMKDEYVSKAYEELETLVGESRTRLSRLERRKQELVDVRKLDAAALAQLSRLYEAEMELARRTLEFDLAQKVYETVATRLEESRLQVVGRTAQLQVMDQALAPTRPVAPKIARNAIIGLCAGVLLAALGVVFASVDRSRAA